MVPLHPERSLHSITLQHLVYILKADSYYIQYINYLLSKQRSKSRFPQGITPQDLCIQVFILKLKNNRKEKYM